MNCQKPLEAWRTRDGDIRFAPHSLAFQDGEKLLIPCGQCKACRINKSKVWAVRCCLEAQYHGSSLFLTLTYDDDHLPVYSYSTEEVVTDILTGECEIVDESLHVSHPLQFDDLQLFLKRLRKALAKMNYPKIRFFGCGEYGSLRNRPHYHLLVFGMFMPRDAVLHSRNFRGDGIYKSAWLQDIWGKGFVSIGEANYQTAAYIARYCTKKLTGHLKSWYDEHGLVPEASRMSNRPGIARSYYDEKSDEIYECDEVTILGKDKKQLKVLPPKYFDDLYADMHEERVSELKELRKQKAISLLDAQLRNTSLSLGEYLQLKNDTFDDNIRKLKRSIL